MLVGERLTSFSVNHQIGNVDIFVLLKFENKFLIQSTEINVNLH